MIKLRLPALALVAVLAGPALAQAQDAAAPSGAAPAARGWDKGDMKANMQARRAERMKALHQALNIRPDQETAFTAFTAAMQPQPGGRRDGDKGADRAAMAAMTTPERLDRMGQKMDERMARMKAQFQRRASAAKALYAVLSPDQKHTMDALDDLMGSRRGGGGMGRGRGGGWDGGRDGARDGARDGGRPGGMG